MSRVAATVIVPTFHRPRQLEECLRALAAQTLVEPWEVVVVDDGSPEPVALDLEEVGFPAGCRVLRQENAGPAAARNRGVQQARGEFVAFTDDDCRPHATWLAGLVEAARRRPGALVGGSTRNGLQDEIFASASQLIVDLVYEHFNRDRDSAYFLASNNILCARERFLDLGGFDASFPRAGAEDRDFCDRWRAQGWPIVWHPEAVVEHRHPQTLRKFLDLHVRYGRGAYRYQAMRRSRGSGTMREDLGFHRSLPRRLWRHLGRGKRPLHGVAMVAALIAWQAANAAGFCIEAVSRQGRRGGA